jgi:hypothetical protein
MSSVALHRPYQAERTAKQTRRQVGRGNLQATLLIFDVIKSF